VSTTKPEPVGTRGPAISRDLASGVVMGAIAAFFWWNAGEIVEGGYDWLFPVALSAALGALSLVLVVRGLVWPTDPVSVAPPRGRDGRDLIAFLTVIVAYVVVTPMIGFWLSSATMIAGATVLLTPERTWRTVLFGGVAGLTAAAVGYVTFTYIFFVNFPLGPWGG
jgi:Tripartite tricarboxylate transporter TctB family